MSNAERDEEPVEQVTGPAPSEDSSLPPEDEDPIQGEEVDVDRASEGGFGPPGGG